MAAAVAAEAATDTVKVTLEEQNNSGKSGTAELPGAASTDVTIEMQGTSDLDPIYVRSGTCEAPGSEVVHDIGFTAADLGQGQIFVPINEVATGEFILTIEDDQTMEPIMCGDPGAVSGKKAKRRPRRQSRQRHRKRSRRFS